MESEIIDKIQDFLLLESVSKKEIEIEVILNMIKETQYKIRYVKMRENSTHDANFRLGESDCEKKEY